MFLFQVNTQKEIPKEKASLPPISIEQSDSSFSARQMEHRLYELFNRLNFNLVDAKAPQNPNPEKGEVRQNLNEFIADLLSFYEKAKSVEEFAFCHSAFKWLKSYLPEIGNSLPGVDAYLADIGKTCGSDPSFKSGSIFTLSKGTDYYDAFIETLRRSVVEGKSTDSEGNEIDVVRFHLSEKGIAQVAYWINSLKKGGSAAAITRFDTEEEADVFVKEVLNKFGGISFDATIEQSGSRWAVKWSAELDKSRKAAPYIQEFGNEVVNFGIGDRDEEQVKTPSQSNKPEGTSYILPRYEGTAKIPSEQDFLDMLKMDDVSSKTSKGKAYLQTFQALTLAVRNLAWNTESDAIVEFYTTLSFAILAEKAGFKTEIPIESILKTTDINNPSAIRTAVSGMSSAINAFLQSEDGKAFLEELNTAAKNGEFVVYSSASSEYLVSQNGWNDLYNKQLKKVADTRGNMAVSKINDIIAKAYQNDTSVDLSKLLLSSVPSVPIVWPLEPLSDSRRQMLMGYGLSSVPESARSSIEPLLKEHYSDETIDANVQRIFSTIYEDMKSGDPEAIRVWNALAKGKSPAIKMDDERFYISNANKLNGLLSLAHSPIRKPGSYFDNVLGSTTRFAAFELHEKMTIGLEIGTGVRNGDEMSVPITPFSIANTKNGNKDAPFEGNIVHKVFERDLSGGEWKETSSVFVDGKAVFKVQDGKIYSVEAYAVNTQGSIATELVKRTEKTEEILAWKDVTVDRPMTEIYHPGDIINLPFTARRDITYLSGEKITGTASEGTDSYMAFTVKINNEMVPSYFTCPGEVEFKNEFTYSVSWTDKVNGKETVVSKDVIIDRGLAGEGISYSKEELIKMAKSGAIAIKVSYETRGQNPKTLFEWVSLDGKTTLDPAIIAGAKIDGNRLVASKPNFEMREVLSTSSDNSPNQVLAQLDSNERRIANLLVQRSILLPEDDVKIGADTYSQRQIRNLAKEHIIAFIAENGTGKKTVYGLNGQILGVASEVSQYALPDINGILVYRPKSDETDFSWQTYAPDVSSKREELKGFIYSPTPQGRIAVKSEKEK